MTRSRFFSHTSEEGDNSSAARTPRSTKMAGSSNSSGSGSGSGSGTASRWRCRRLRRSDAHDFNDSLKEITPALSGDSLGSGYTEAPSSRGTSTASLSTCSPALGAVGDGALDVEDFDLDGGDDELSWLDDDLLPETAAAAVSDSRLDEFAAEQKPQRFAGPLVLHVHDFECGECVGKGSYSKVFLGTHVPTETEWALKVVSKRKTFETRENLAHLREERYISTKLQGSDFLVRTAGTFNTTKSVVFAMEYLPGGDLYQRLADKGTLSLGEAVAWTAQAVLAIEDLHAKNIVHRDVKPENFLMGKSGTLKLTDFGFARELEPEERLYSQFGTPEYVAPEVLNGCGHGMAVDLWALGVLIYELLVGQTPFKSPSVDEMYERIAAGDYAFPAPPPPPPRAPRSRRDRAPTAAAAEGFSKPTKEAAAAAAAKPGLLSGVQAFGSGGSGGGGGATVKKSPAVEGATRTADTKHNSSSSSSNSSNDVQQARQHPAQLERLRRRQQRQPQQPPRPQQHPRSKSESSAATPAPASAIHHPTTSTSRKNGSRAAATSGGGRRGAHDPAAQSLVKALLCLSPGRRPNIAEVKQHPFFAGVNFGGLRAAVRAQAERDEEEAVVAAAIGGIDGEVWVRGQPVECVSEEVDDNYGGVFEGF